MKWLALHIDTSPAGLEPVEAALSALGIDGLVIEDETDFRRFLEQNKQYWDYVDEELDRSMTGKCRITFYAEESEAGFGQVAAARIALAGLKEIGERLMVIPDWEEADPKGRAALRLNPGLAFGTGGHATTRLCLTALEKIVEPGMKVLDLGCGSGILSIAALLLGAERAFACDIDDKAVDVAYENAALNGVDRDRYAVRAGDVLSDAGLRREMGTGYDVVVANIVSDVIIALAPAVRGLMKEGGRFLASGIIDSREEEVRAALEAAGLTVEEARASEGWVSFLCN